MRDRVAWMAAGLCSWRSSLAVTAGAMAIVACGGTQRPPPASKSSPRATELTCSDSVYTASIRRSVTPKAFKAIEIGPAIFNDLREARDPRMLQRDGSLLTYKSPLTIAAAGEVTITVSSVHSGRIVLLYGTAVTDRLGPTAQIAAFRPRSAFGFAATPGACSVCRSLPAASASRNLGATALRSRSRSARHHTSSRSARAAHVRARSDPPALRSTLGVRNNGAPGRSRLWRSAAGARHQQRLATR